MPSSLSSSLSSSRLMELLRLRAGRRGLRVSTAQVNMTAGQATCAKHGEVRSKRFMRLDLRSGEYNCRKKHPCDERPELAMCVQHGKMRQRSHLKEGKRGLRCDKQKCRPFLTGRCTKCGVETSASLRATSRDLVSPTLTRYLPSDATWNEEKVLLCSRCAKAFDKMVEGVRLGLIEDYQKVMHERLISRLDRCKNSMKVKDLLTSALQQKRLTPEILGTEIEMVPGRTNWVTILCAQCSAFGEKPPKFDLRAIQNRTRRIRRMCQDTTRFAVPFTYKVTANGTKYKAIQGFPDRSYYRIASPYFRRKLKSRPKFFEGEKASIDHHREMQAEVFADAVGKRNFRRLGMELAARNAMVHRIGDQLGEKLDKHAKAMLDSVVQGPELERRAVHRMFRGRSTARSINIAVQQFLSFAYQTAKNWVSERIHYEEDD
mmetsp:Transcript_7517/g.11892  ORF Transcript_7517/g.11892 Transcript_7517/m.11892 type:complete len:432 (+) Transcript_7517:155-1450(+)